MRPKLILGHLYYMKQSHVWVPQILYNSGSYQTHEYIVEVLEIEEVEKILEKIGIKNSPSTDLRYAFRIIASTQEEDMAESSRPGDDIDKGWIRYITLANKRQPGEPVIKKLNKKNLPLYINWAFGKENIMNLLKEYA